jgi:hypothetical protein
MSNSDDEENPMVLVTKLAKILKDVGYICGLSFSTFTEYVTGSFEEN